MAQKGSYALRLRLVIVALGWRRRSCFASLLGRWASMGWGPARAVRSIGSRWRAVGRRRVQFPSGLFEQFAMQMRTTDENHAALFQGGFLNSLTPGGIARIEGPGDREVDEIANVGVLNFENELFALLGIFCKDCRRNGSKALIAFGGR